MRFLVGALLICLSSGGFSHEDASGLNIERGAGSYGIQLGPEASKASIDIHYYLPANHNEDTSVIIVIPGAGRNANDYRDSWIENAEKYNLLVLSPSYPKDNFDFAAYQLGGVVNDLELRNPEIERVEGRIKKFRMSDEDIGFSFVGDKSVWIFDDFDEVFKSVEAIVGPKQTGYDLFGHSAGGQILHRYAILKNHSKANRIVAANSGFYTLPDLSTRYPFGVEGTPLTKDEIKKSFTNHLIVLLGVSDNASETRGTMLHTPSSDSQGLGRFERGTYFFNESKKLSQSVGAAFNWQIIPVEGVGHNYRRMGEAAAKLLYGNR